MRDVVVRHGEHGQLVTEPGLSASTPARSKMDARSVYMYAG